MPLAIRPTLLALGTMSMPVVQTAITLMYDIVILASTDLVALEKSCIDLVYSAYDGKSLIQHIDSRNGLHTLEHASEIELGKREYQLVEIDG